MGFGYGVTHTVRIVKWTAAIGIIAALSVSACAAAHCGQDGAAIDRARVLFVVGGPAFHDPVELPKLLKDVVEKTGAFEVTITEDREQFRPENINRFDLVMIYTTGHQLTQEQEEGLVKFVNDGGGLVGIHSATDSFKNSDAYWKLLGGRFTGHGSGKFRVNITGKRHVIVRDMEPFEIEDETYVHEFHPDSRLVVLMRRDEDGEPVSWVQYYGEGRVFVTGLGHGAPAWSNPAFQQMIVNALHWAKKTLNP